MKQDTPWRVRSSFFSFFFLSSDPSRVTHLFEVLAYCVSVPPIVTSRRSNKDLSYVLNIPVPHPKAGLGGGNVPMVLHVQNPVIKSCRRGRDIQKGASAGNGARTIVIPPSRGPRLKRLARISQGTQQLKVFLVALPCLVASKEIYRTVSGLDVHDQSPTFRPYQGNALWHIARMPVSCALASAFHYQHFMCQPLPVPLSCFHLGGTLVTQRTMPACPGHQE